ncbi:hypothetical protein [Flavobacterium yafengii]|uniref:PIR Superfamily Protein n=1 Tax=Flavobacterium yafengii TaxID=3041253 RepID=A0AAW6TNG5_9FLAO|nr:hypothetical protein [Flavobacterium yafengii]MDI5948905.1 hypothetical protein [Flavobacterium yafengii]MDI6045095.1 hypothetical protein [Flavobacterium yafengii]
MNSIELQNRYYDSIVENYSLHCQNGGDYNNFKNLINYDLCFQKIDELIIDELLVTWCYHDCISKYWTTKLITDLLLPVNIDDLIKNRLHSKDTEDNIIEYYYFEKYNDFLSAKDKFSTSFK